MFLHKKQNEDVHPEYPNFPLGLRPGAILAMDEGEALRFAGLSLSFALPKGEVLVTALSAMELFGLTLVRAYADAAGTPLLVQFNCEAGTVKDISLFTLLQEIRPATAEEWGSWLDPGGLIGGADINAPNGKRYLRQWGEGDCAAPVAAREAVFTDPAKAPRRIDHQMMLYARDEGEEAENLLLSADTEPGEALIRAWVGVDFSSYGVKVY